MGSDIAELLERVEKATGPDRDLDGAIAAAFGKPHGAVEWIEDRSFISTEQQASPFTSSLDAALALVEEKLPGCNSVLMFGEPYRNPIMRLAPLHDGGRHPIEAGGATLPLAVLSALLRALSPVRGTDK